MEFEIVFLCDSCREWLAFGTDLKRIRISGNSYSYDGTPTCALCKTPVKWIPSAPMFEGGMPMGHYADVTPITRASLATVLTITQARALDDAKKAANKESDPRLN